MGQKKEMVVPILQMGHFPGTVNRHLEIRSLHLSLDHGDHHLRVRMSDSSRSPRKAPLYLEKQKKMASCVVNTCWLTILELSSSTALSMKSHPNPDDHYTTGRFLQHPQRTITPQNTPYPRTTMALTMSTSHSHHHPTSLPHLSPPPLPAWLHGRHRTLLIEL